MGTNIPGYLRTTIILFLLIMIFAVLYFARSFLMPVCLAALFAILLNPMEKWLERRGMHRIFAIFICLFAILIVISGLLFLAYTQLSNFASDIPQLQSSINKKLNGLQSFIEGQTNMSPEKQIEWLRKRATSYLQGSGQMIQNTITATTSTVAVLALLPLYIFFFLYYKEKFKKFIFKVTAVEKHHKVDSVLEQVKSVVQNYLSGVLLVVVILAVLNTSALLAIGIPYAIFLGVLAALLNIVPYIGILIGNIISVLIAFLTKDSLWYPAGVLIAFAVIQFIENNFLTPNIVGQKVSVNPLVTVMALVIGGKLWGVTGMIIFIPLLGMLKVVFDNIENLKPYGYLLGTEGAEVSVDTNGFFKKIRKWFTRE